MSQPIEAPRPRFLAPPQPLVRKQIFRLRPAFWKKEAALREMQNRLEDHIEVLELQGWTVVDSGTLKALLVRTDPRFFSSNQRLLIRVNPHGKIVQDWA